jgi:uncharacterized membrane protein YgdD (TMEM256/DUF423 family)
MNARFFLICGLILMVTGVALGAFGAHAIKSSVTPELLQTWQTASQYHFYHALGLIGLGIWFKQGYLDRWARTGGMLLLLGIVLFSGSLYLLVLTGNTKLGMITPIGGVSFMAGWLSWLVSISRGRTS